MVTPGNEQDGELLNFLDSVIGPPWASGPQQEEVGQRGNLQASTSGSQMDDTAHQSGDADLSPTHSGRKGKNGQLRSGTSRADRAKERNRISQKAYRMRQQAKAKDAEQHIKELAAQLKAVQLEKTSLEQRNRTLEKALSCANNSMKTQITPVEAIPCGREFTAWSYWERFDRKDTLVLTLGEASVQLRLTSEASLQMELHEMARYWKALVNNMAACLADANNDPNSVAGQRIKGLVSEATALCAYTALNNPVLLTTFNCALLEESPLVPRRADMKYWSSIMRMLNLTHEQKRHLLMQRRSYLASVATTLEQRRNVHASSLQLLREEDLVESCGFLADAYFNMRENAEKLSNCADSLHFAKCIFMQQAWRRTLAPVQSANFIVQAYPFGPNMRALVGCIAHEYNEPPVAELLGCRPSSLAMPMHCMLGSKSWPQHSTVITTGS